MKQLLIGGAIVLVLVVGGVWYGVWHLRRQYSGAEGSQVGFAIGKAYKDQAELHVVVTRDRVMADPPRRLADGGVQTWLDWIKEHYELRDDVGNQIRLDRAGTSMVINSRVAFNPEFYLIGKLKVGTTYQLDYIPYFDEPKRHRHSFLAPAEGQEFQRMIFKTVRVE